MTGVHEPLPKVPGEDREVGFDLDELQECWQSLGVVAAAEGGGSVYHLVSAPRQRESSTQICHAAVAEFPERLDPSTHVAPKGELAQSAGVRAHVGSFRVTERGEMNTLGAAPHKNPHPEFPPY